jgi:hypothetical protein
MKTHARAALQKADGCTRASIAHGFCDGKKRRIVPKGRGKVMGELVIGELVIGELVNW